MKRKQILTIIMAFVLTSGLVHAEEYLELLVKTSDNVFSAKPRFEWTAEMRAKERRSNGKRGYIIRVEQEGFEWGRLEKDPKRYAIIKIAKKDFKKEWLEPEYDKSKPIKDEDGAIIGYKIKTQRKYRLPLKAFLSKSELKSHKNIPYNEKKLRSAIRKTLKDVNKKIKKVDWKNRSAELKLHGSAGTFTIKASGGDYTSLSSWESAEKCDLTADGGQGACIAECYNDFENGMQDRVIISGWTTDADNYIKVYTPESERHNGTVTNAIGAYTGFAICADAGNNSPWNVIDVLEPYTIIDGLIVDVAKKPNIRGIRVGVAPSTIKNCIILNSLKDNVYLVTTAWGAKVVNCLSYNAGYTGFYMKYSGSLYNCTSIGNTYYGFQCYGLGGYSASIKNCLANNNVLGDIVENRDITMDVRYCATSDNTATNWAGTGNRVNQTFTFVDTAKNDYHLSGNDTGALGYGVNLSSDASFPFNYDIDGDIRSGSWDIGADAFTLDGLKYYLK